MIKFTKYKGFIAKKKLDNGNDVVLKDNIGYFLFESEDEANNYLNDHNIDNSNITIEPLEFYDVYVPHLH